MVETRAEIIIPILFCILYSIFRFKGRIMINDLAFIFENLITFNFAGSILGLYANSLVYDIIDYLFNKQSIIAGSISTLLLILAYKTKYRKLFFFLDFGLFLFILLIKGGYKVGFSSGVPYASIILFDIISILFRLQLFRIIVHNFNLVILISITIILITLKFLSLGYPLIERII